MFCKENPQSLNSGQALKRLSHHPRREKRDFQLSQRRGQSSRSDYSSKPFNILPLNRAANENSWLHQSSQHTPLHNKSLAFHRPFQFQHAALIKQLTIYIMKKQ
jgi:hypothetical protein